MSNQNHMRAAEDKYGFARDTVDEGCFFCADSAWGLRSEQLAGRIYCENAMSLFAGRSSRGYGESQSVNGSRRSLGYTRNGFLSVFAKTREKSRPCSQAP